MMAWKVVVRSITLVAAVCCLAGLANAQNTTVTVSPGNLSFGVPTGSTTSAPQAVTISVGGNGNRTVNSISVSLPSANNAQLATFDFTEADTCGTNPQGSNTISAPGSCAINVTFTPSQAAGILETATLTIGISGSDNFNIPLTGALGAIRLFDPINVARSIVTFPNLATLGSTNLNLSCPASPTATLSSTPDGHGNVVVDNYVTLFVNNQAVGGGAPAGNVCTGGPSDNNGGTQQNDCFTTTYQQQLTVGANPDNSTSTWGVPPIDVSAAFANEGPASPAASIAELDAGGFYAGSTLFLATSCSLTNANTGNETGNPITTQQPAQTLSFDTVPNNLDQYTFDYSFAFAGGEVTNANSTPSVANASLSQGAYTNLVNGSPFQNTSCIPLQSLSGNCALKTQVCTLTGGQTASGENCPQSNTANILFTGTFDPSVPAHGLIPGFGFLEFNDQGNCTDGFGGPEAGSACPQNGLVFFTGPGEVRSGTGKKTSNSSYVVVQGVTPPSTAVNITPFFPTVPGSGWTNGNPSATFTSTPGPTTPAIAPIQFFEYGVNNQTSPGVPGLPPTFPLPFLGNGTFASDISTTPATCPPAYPATAPSVPTGPVSLATRFPNAHFSTDGSVNLLNYSTTDCANTHELQFRFDGTKWSTSFKSITLMSDTVAPTITLTTPPVSGGSYSANQKVKANYGCVDIPLESDVASCAGTVANGANIDTTPNGLSTTKTFTVNSSDNVGNSATTGAVSYTVTCNYAAVTLRPGSVRRGSFVNVTTSVADCVNTPKSVKVQFTLSGPLGKNCGHSSTVMFTTPTFTIRSGASNSFTFPFPIARSACVGTYTVTTTTLQGSMSIDSVSSTLTVTN